MLDKMISTQVFEQPKLGKLFYEQGKIEQAKRDKVGENLNSTQEAATIAMQFMPAKSTQIATVQLERARDLYTAYSKSGSQSSLNEYQNVITELKSTLAIGQSRYKQGRTVLDQAQADGFEKTEGGQEFAQQQWSDVMLTPFDEMPSYNNGILTVTDRGQAMPLSQSVYNDVKNINPGTSDFMLKKESKIPELSLPLNASKLYSPILGKYPTWPEAKSAITNQMGIDQGGDEFNRAAALYYYRDVLKRGMKDGIITSSEKKEAYDLYGRPDAAGFEVAQGAWRDDTLNRLEEEFLAAQPETNSTAGLTSQDKAILDRPLQEWNTKQVMGPNQLSQDLDLYKLDLSALDVAYNKIEGHRVSDVYFTANGNLDHFTVKVPLDGGSDDNIFAFLEMDDVNVEGLPEDATYNDKLSKWRELANGKAAQKKFISIRISDPRKLESTLGVNVTTILRERIAEANAGQVEANKNKPGFGASVAGDMPTQ